jgi:hypothetical protein
MTDRLEAGLSQHQDPDEGDFTIRSLPKTYGYYLKNRLYEGAEATGIDGFDYFIRTEVPILQFLNDQYYANKKNPRLRLDQLCGDPTLLDLFDESILSYISHRKSQANLMKLQSNYLIILENCILRLIAETKP